MRIQDPAAEVVAAVNAAARWLQDARLAGISVQKRPDPHRPKGWDRVVVADPLAPPLWARFYDIPSMRPVFCGEDGIVRFSLAEIDYGRRVGYDWYVGTPAEVIERVWPEWRAALARARRSE
jgi:PelA/Pel-15E family pectate lyase